MIYYNKAIRDKIPEIIKNSGNNCNVKKLTDDEFLIEIEAKLREELEEYFQSKSVEELADIIEVVNRISVLRGVSEEELEKIENLHRRSVITDDEKTKMRAKILGIG